MSADDQRDRLRARVADLGRGLSDLGPSGDRLASKRMAHERRTLRTRLLQYDGKAPEGLDASGPEVEAEGSASCSPPAPPSPTEPAPRSGSGDKTADKAPGPVPARGRRGPDLSFVLGAPADDPPSAPAVAGPTPPRVRGRLDLSFVFEPGPAGPSPEPAPSHDVFVSFAPGDARRVAEEIVGPLRSAGLLVRAESREDWPSGDERARILADLDDCRSFVAVASPGSRDSPWVLGATRWAREHRGDRLIPALLGDLAGGSALLSCLEGSPAIDFRHDPRAAAIGLIARINPDGRRTR